MCIKCELWQQFEINKTPGETKSDILPTCPQVTTQPTNQPSKLCVAFSDSYLMLLIPLLQFADETTSPARIKELNRVRVVSVELNTRHINCTVFSKVITRQTYNMHSGGELICPV